MSEGPNFTTEDRWGQAHIKAHFPGDVNEGINQALAADPETEPVPVHLQALHLLGALSFIYGYSNAALNGGKPDSQDLKTIKAKALEGLTLAGMKVSA